MTRKQLDQVGVAATEAHWWWIDRTSVSDGIMVDVTMPPIGWRTLADAIPQHAFGPLGGRKQKTESLAAGLRRISLSLAVLESHPAFKFQGLRGRHFEMFVAWGESPYPRLQAEPSMLLPHPREVGGIVMTEWRRHYSAHGYGDLFEPEFHWRFTPPPASPASSPSPPQPGSTPADTSGHLPP